MLFHRARPLSEHELQYIQPTDRSCFVLLFFFSSNSLPLTYMDISVAWSTWSHRSSKRAHKQTRQTGVSLPTSGPFNFQTRHVTSFRRSKLAAERHNLLDPAPLHSSSTVNSTERKRRELKSSIWYFKEEKKRRRGGGGKSSNFLTPNLSRVSCTECPGTSLPPTPVFPRG